MIIFPSENSKKAVFLEGPAGKLEAELAAPNSKNPEIIAIVCHPHPLHHGTMQNKVVTMCVKAFLEKGFYTVRFNFRGVAKSFGEHGNIDGEVEDLLAVYNQIIAVKPKAAIWLAGFSFGGYIAAKVASLKKEVKQLITIAPSVVNMPYKDLGAVACPWTVIQGDKDEIVDSNKVLEWYENLKADKQLIVMKDATHFFHGRLVELKDHLLGLAN